MLRRPKYIKKTLSVSLSLKVVSAMAILLVASLTVMLHYSRREIKEEALEKASQTLEGMVQGVDNILLSVEQATGNIYFSMLPYIDQPDKMASYCRELLEANPLIYGCAIAFKPYFYKDRELFMAYVYRAGQRGTGEADSTFVETDTFGNIPYTEQVWYTNPMTTAIPSWLNPTEDMDAEGIEHLVTFCLPIPGKDGKPVGVMGVDVALSPLTRIVLANKPSPNSYCTLLDREGSFIVHPDIDKLYNQTVFTQTQRGADPTVKTAAQAMVKGETGYKPFRMNGTDYYVFYKPFKRDVIPGRVMKETGWSAGIIYPKDDIFGDYDSLLYYVYAIAVASILLLFVLSHIIIHRQLKPLQMLSDSARRIAKGNYGTSIPDSHQKDEIGRLQDNFQQMQKSLASHMGELEQLSATIQARGDELRIAYSQAQKADRMKTSFLHNMTNQMVGPSNAIYDDVNALCNVDIKADLQETGRLANDIQANGKAITELLNNLIRMSDEEKGKEASHD